MNKYTYTVVKDGAGWGVTDGTALINEESMNKSEAQELARECNRYANNCRESYADENPLWDTLSEGGQGLVVIVVAVAIIALVAVLGGAGLAGLLTLLTGGNGCGVVAC